MMDINTISDWSDEDLEAAKATIDEEKTKRYTVKSAERQMDRLMWDYSSAIGRNPGDLWAQPTGAHDAYPSGMIVVHDGSQWISLITGNVWEPGVSGWREYVESGSDVVPEYLPPTGAHDVYKAGDRVTFRGEVYESVIDSNVYSPDEYAQGWVKMNLFDPPTDEAGSSPETDTPAGEPGSESESGPGTTGEVIEPDIEPEVPEIPTWVQPTGGHDAYGIGDQVLFEGAVYESVIDGNSWSPTGYPAGWKKI